jgi:VanZ family protein
MPDDMKLSSGSNFQRFLIYIGPLLLWMIVIFYLSTDHGSKGNTLPAIRSILYRLWPDAPNHLSFEMINRIDWNIRKTCHIVEYLILGLFAFRAVAFGSREVRPKNILLPLLIGVAYATSDEIHQSFIPSRTGAAADIFFDVFGINTALILCLWHQCARLQKK